MGPRLRNTRGGQALAALGCLVLSPLNTVILKTRLEMTQQRAIEAARVLGADTLDLYNQCDVIEAKLQQFLQMEIGVEIFYQIGLQVVLLLLTVTKTATVGGFEIYFKKDPKHDYGLDFNPTQLIFLSVLWSLKTAIFRHVKILSMEKGFFGFKAKIAAFLWGLVAT